MTIRETLENTLNSPEQQINLEFAKQDKINFYDVLYEGSIFTKQKLTDEENQKFIEFSQDYDCIYYKGKTLIVKFV